MPENYFVTYQSFKEPDETPVYISPLFDKPINIDDWALGYSPSGDIVLNESSAAKELKSRMNLDYENVNPQTSTDFQQPYVTNTKQSVAKQNLSENRKKAMNYFKSKGLNDYQAAGLVGNLIRESDLDPKALNESSGATGIAQWLGARKKKLFNKYGKNPTFEQQLDFVWEELNSSHKKGLDMLLSSKNVEEAAANAFGYYEFSVGPQGAIAEMNKYNQNGKASYDKGIKFAKSLLS